MIDVLASFYVSPQFRVKDREGKSSYRTQKTGIRQGCPLSPYLFICLMTVMFHDVHNEVDCKISTMARLEHPLLNHWELVYADDTMLIGKRARDITINLVAIERAFTKYNLKLNYDKCEYIGMNGKAHIHFSNGKPMKEISQATYLGGIISNDASRWNDLNN